MLGLMQEKEKTQTRDQPRIPDKQNLPCVSIPRKGPTRRDNCDYFLFRPVQPIRVLRSLSPGNGAFFFDPR